MPSTTATSQEQTSPSAREPRFELTCVDLLLELLPDGFGVFPGVDLRHEPVADAVAAIEALVVADEHGAGAAHVEPE